MQLTDKWHGVPLYVWFGGAGVVAGGLWYWYKKGKAGAATAASQATGNTSPTGGGGYYSGGGGGPLSISGNPLPDVSNATQQIADATTQAVQAITAATKQVTDQLPVPPVSATGPMVPAPSSPAPPPPIASALPDNWQQVASVPPAPPGYAATPIVNAGSIIGENLIPNNELNQVTAPWQQGLGLAPAPPGATNLQPIVVGGSTVGESFSGGTSLAPSPNDIVQSPFGPVTQAQYDLLKATGRV
jgi:hypothetical protein